MKRYDRILNIVILSCGIALGGLEHLTIGNAAYAQSALNSIFGVSVPIIDEASGLVEIRRKNSGKYVPAGEGTLLFEGDLVRLDSEAIAKVFCPNGVTRSVNAGATSGISTICPSNRQTRGTTLDSRGNDDFLQYIDRRFYNLTILEQSQVIRWQMVKGAKSYRVQLATPQETLLDVQMNCPEIVYSGQKPLALGGKYNLLVTADDGKDVVKLSLQVLSAEKRQQLEQKLTSVRSLSNLSAISKAIALADIYGEYDLSEQAIAELEKVSQSGKSLALVEQRLGNLSLQIGLKAEAEGHFLKSLTLAEMEKNSEAIAEAQIGIAKVFVASGKKQESAMWLQKALVSYGNVENKPKLDAIAMWFKKLNGDKKS